MHEKQEQTDWSTWFSTYGLLTAERILERFNIHLPHDELIRAVKDPNGVYFLLLRVPLKNVFNGIILQQAHDYQIYAQKLFVDYLLSGEDIQEPGSMGDETRDDLEQQRMNLIEMGEAFYKQEEAHQVLIAESQASLISLSQNAQLNVANAYSMERDIANYIERAEDININLRGFRSQFYHIILQVTALLRLLTDYKIDELKVIENRVALEFDALLGEE